MHKQKAKRGNSTLNTVHCGHFRSVFYVVVDAIGLETDFTLETNRKGVKEKLLKST